MKVVIKQWNGVASWRWDMPEDEVCGICRVQFDGTCPTCKYPGDDCALCTLSYEFEVQAVNPLNSTGQMWPFFSHGERYTYFEITRFDTHDVSIVFSHGSSKILPKVYVLCAGKVHFLQEQPRAFSLTRS